VVAANSHFSPGSTLEDAYCVVGGDRSHSARFATGCYSPPTAFAIPPAPPLEPRPPRSVETRADPHGVHSRRPGPKATGTPEFADSGDALKLDDTEDAVVGSPHSRPNRKPPPRTCNGFDIGQRRTRSNPLASTRPKATGSTRAGMQNDPIDPNFAQQSGAQRRTRIDSPTTETKDLTTRRRHSPCSKRSQSEHFERTF
jgi:hypothetical protein